MVRFWMYGERLAEAGESKRRARRHVGSLLDVNPEMSARRRRRELRSSDLAPQLVVRSVMRPSVDRAWISEVRALLRPREPVTVGLVAAGLP